MGFHTYWRRITFVVLGLLAAAPASAQPAVDFKLFFESQSGDWVGDGQTKTYTQADGTVSSSSSATTVRVGINGVSFGFWWDATFFAPGGIVPGVYNTARRSPFTSHSNGLSFSGSGRGCNERTGRFVVLEAHYGLAGIERFAAEQHCEDRAAGLFGCRALGELRPLPAGASFDAARGVFTWQPGAGYIGRYDIVVVVSDGQGAQLRYEVQVTCSRAGSDHLVVMYV